MGISQEDFDTLKELADTIESSLSDAEYIIKNADPNLYDRWAAYGKHVTGEFVIGGPSLPEVIEKLEADIDGDEDEDEDEDEEAMKDMEDKTILEG